MRATNSCRRLQSTRHMFRVMMGHWNLLALTLENHRVYGVDFLLSLLSYLKYLYSTPNVQEFCHGRMICENYL